jgi:hypothetical protein
MKGLESGTTTMSLAYRISPSGDRVRIVGIGEITTDDCIGMVKRVLSNPRRRPNATALIDLRDATYKPQDQAEVIDVAMALATFHSRVKNHIAIVAKQSTIFPAEIFAAYLRKATHLGIRVFADIAAAKAYCCRGNLAGAIRPTKNRH